MRYLGHVLVRSQAPHIKEICVVDMLARTCKNMLNRNLAELIIENRVEHEQLMRLKNNAKYRRQTHGAAKASGSVHFESLGAQGDSNEQKLYDEGDQLRQEESKV